MPSDAALQFVPTLEIARAAKAPILTRVWWKRGPIDLLKREPSRTHKLAAVAVVAEPGMRYVYVPSMPFQLQEALRELYEAERAPMPDCLRVDVEHEGGGDPYRGIATTPAHFRGHDYGDALVRARSLARELLRKREGEVRVDAFAWPILWLRFGGFILQRDVALVVRPDRVLHAIVRRA